MSRRDQMMAGSSALPAPATVGFGEDHLATRDLARPSEIESGLAAQVQDLVAAGDAHAARDLFAQIVNRQQRRASRIAWHYLRDAADADEAVQDAFVKAYTHIASFQRNLSFEVWLTRILINGCLDRQKARTRRSRWMMPVADAGRRDQDTIERATRPSDRSPEELLLAREWRERLTAAVKRLPGRQRTVFMLCHYADHSTSDVAEITGLNESTVRVHLFRAIRKLRAAMEAQRHAV
ncbi:MAG TPA: sigma-70 family RNA polymerase sigma factor [Vicinamibacterales bacterium]|nr:sigma-70 family RNA polymerase sigma factor [Vicinamibacterales bacterium]